MNKRHPIGVMDSGVGGLTLVRELKKLCPGEDIVYFGDSANCPYGNRSQEEILQLSHRMIDFLKESRVKVVAIACNTISALVDDLAREQDFEIVGIVSPVSRMVAQSGIKEVGVFATEFTVASGIYNRTIQQANPAIEVYGKGSPNLAALVDQGQCDQDSVREEIRKELGTLLSRQPLQHVILGCTHYPIVSESFQSCFPNVVYINPALEQAKTLVEYLDKQDLLNPQAQGNLTVYTSGDTRNYKKIVERLGLNPPSALQQIAL